MKEETKKIKMKTITEIFETNPSLLNEPEVKELVEQFKLQYQKLEKDKYEYWNKITDITMNSELFVIKGTTCKEALSKIHEISF